MTIVLSVAVLIIVGALIALWPKDAQTLDQFVGKPAPDFTLRDYNGATVTLSSLQGNNVVLFFSEGVMCYPACWDQTVSLRNDARLNSQNTVEYSIVVDQKDSWANYISKQPSLAPSVLFDATKAVSSAYGVLSLPSSMHPGTTPGHTYFVVDKQGIIRYAFDDPGMRVNNDRLVNELSTLS